MYSRKQHTPTHMNNTHSHSYTHEHEHEHMHTHMHTHFPAYIYTKHATLTWALAQEYVQAKKMADSLPEPKPTLKMTFYSMLVSLTRIFLPFHERYLRQAGHVHYNEIMLAMLYWYSVRV